MPKMIPVHLKLFDEIFDGIRNFRDLAAAGMINPFETKESTGQLNCKISAIFHFFAHYLSFHSLVLIFELFFDFFVLRLKVILSIFYLLIVS